MDGMSQTVEGMYSAPGLGEVVHFGDELMVGWNLFEVMERVLLELRSGEISFRSEDGAYLS